MQPDSLFPDYGKDPGPKKALDPKLKVQPRPNTQTKHYKRTPRAVPQRDERDRKFY